MFLQSESTCGSTEWKAASTTARKHGKKAETGCMLASCRHCFLLKGLDMTRGKVYAYPYILQVSNLVWIWKFVIATDKLHTSDCLPPTTGGPQVQCFWRSEFSPDQALLLAKITDDQKVTIEWNLLLATLNFQQVHIDVSREATARI